MRLLVAHPGPSFSVQDVFNGWLEAFRELGQQVAEYNLGERLTFYDAALLETPERELRKALSAEQATQLAVNGLYSALYRLRPDVLFAVSAFFYPPEVFDLARSYGTAVVLLHTESPYEDTRQARIAQHADHNLINDPTNLSLFPPGTRYVPHAYRPSLHRPAAAVPEMVCDLAFVGTGYASRIAFLERMNLTGLDVILAGNWQALAEDSPLRGFLAHEPEECLDNLQTTQLYRSARTGLNLYRKEAEADHLGAGWAMGPREVEMAATGCFFLREPRPEGDAVLPMLPTFSSPEEASERLRYWLAHPDERRDLALKAREAIADRTFTNHAAALLAELKE